MRILQQNWREPFLAYPRGGILKTKNAEDLSKKKTRGFFSQNNGLGVQLLTTTSFAFTPPYQN